MAKANKNAKKVRGREFEFQEVEDDRFMIKVGQLGGTYVARAFPKSTARSRGTLFEAKGKSSEEAVEALRSKMEVSAADDIAGRREIDGSGFQVPQAKEYASALRQLVLSKAQVEMLKAHAWSEPPGMTIVELARASGFKSVRSAGTSYGKIGAAVSDNLRLEPPPAPGTGWEAGAAVLAVPEGPSGADREVVWIMHPELRDAVRSEL